MHYIQRFNIFNSKVNFYDKIKKQNKRYEDT